MKKKVYHTSPPFEIPHTGDYDYGTAIIQLLQQEGLEVEYLTLGEAIKSQDIKHIVLELRNGVDKLKTSVFTDKFEEWKENQIRKQAIVQIKNYILSDSSASYIPILNLQLRPPDTGFAFVPEDIENFKKAGIQVNVTCHEYQLNGIDRVYYQAVLHKYFAVADTISFFNLSDFTNASKHANHVELSFENLSMKKQMEWKEYGEGKFEEWKTNFTHMPYNLADKVIMTRVPPTVGYKETTFEQFKQREPYIVVFGSIRANKGIREALDLAKAATNIPEAEKIRVKILGTPFGDSRCATMIEMIKARFEGEVIDQVLYGENIKGSNRDATKKLQGHLGAWVQVDEAGIEYIDTNKLNAFLQNLLNKEKELGRKEKSPIDIHIGLTNAEVIEICQGSKYAVKFDNKGWANNASAHITPLVNSCILYTGCGVNTSKEVLKDGKYENAVVFLGNKYSLKDGKKLTVKQKKAGEQQEFYKLKNVAPNNDEGSDKKLITSEMILIDILAREHNSLLNQQTFFQAKQLSQEFTVRLGKEFKEALTEKEKRYAQCHQLALEEKLTKLEAQRLTIQLKQKVLSAKPNTVKELECLISSVVNEHANDDRKHIYNFSNIQNEIMKNLQQDINSYLTFDDQNFNSLEENLGERELVGEEG